MKLSMIVVITSCAPVLAFSRPAMPAQAPPPSIAPMRHIGIRMMPGRSNVKPMYSAVMPPMMI